MKRTLPHSKKRRAHRVFLGALFSMIAGGLGAGLLRTRSALSGIDVSTLLFYYDSLMSEFTDHRVTSMAEVFSSYSVITEVASASIRLAVIAGILFLLAYISLSFSRARVTLSVAVRWKTLRLPWKTDGRGCPQPGAIQRLRRMWLPGHQSECEQHYRMGNERSFCSNNKKFHGWMGRDLGCGFPN